VSILIREIKPQFLQDTENHLKEGVQIYKKKSLCQTKGELDINLKNEWSRILLPATSEVK
jgi:hypothetical protein